MGKTKKNPNQDQQITYAPLKACATYSVPFRKKVAEIEKRTEIDAEDLFVTVHNALFKNEYEAVLNKQPVLRNMVQGNYNLDPQKCQSLIDTATQMFSAVSILQTWEQQKQVFKLDKDFCNQLMQTENLRTIKDFWDYLPFNSFYLDLSSCHSETDEIYNGIHGIFINVHKFCYGEFSGIELTRFKSDDEMYIIDVGVLSNDSSLKTMHIYEKNENSKSSFDIPVAAKSNTEKLFQGNTTKLNKIIYQTLNYLSLSKPDIRESEETKRTYKPRPEGSKPKLKMSEVAKWEVGYRYGAAFRKYAQEHSGPSEGKGTSGKTVSPHFRRAHWHTYGKEVVWQDVIAVKMGDILKEDVPAVIHKVRKPKENIEK